MSSHFLLLLFLFTTTISLASTTSPPPPPPLSPSRSPLPPPQTQFNSIINALIQTGDFKNWANFLSETLNPTTLPPSFTLFAPIDAAFLTPSPPQPAVNFVDPLLFPYHILPLRLSFNSLLYFPINTSFPTLLPLFSLLITNHSTSNFTINGVHIIRPNLYQTPLISVHGVASILDYTVFGTHPPTPAMKYESDEDRKVSSGGRPYYGIWVRVLMYIVMFLLYDVSSSNGGVYQLLWYVNMFLLCISSRRPETYRERLFLFIWLFCLFMLFILSPN